MRAAVVTFVMLIATDAPRPTDEPVAPFSPGSAFADVVLSDSAVPFQSPAFAFTMAPIPRPAIVAMRAIVSAKDPAKPTLPPPAPLVACDEMSLPDAVSAVSVTPADDVTPLIDASFDTFASVIATPAPIAALPPVAASPLAVDDASAVWLEWSESRPPLETTPAWIVARALAFATVTAIAAATLIPPELVDADGVLVAPEPVPPFADAVLSTKLRSPATCESTLPPAVSGAPAALAVAVDDEVDVPLAVNVTAPSAERSLHVVARAV
jgi:hypothetical protein